jgi:hypothetical protein
MPVTAPDTRSLPYRRGSVNSQRPENAQSRARNDAVRRVQTDKRLTYGCRNFYQFLDQHYGWRNGLVYPKLRTLVLKYGLCRRSCQRWIAQLREHGYLSTEPRNGRACRHRLTWAQSVASEAAPVSPLGLINATEEVTEPAGAAESVDPGPAGAGKPCPMCNGTYYRTVTEYFFVGRQRRAREKRVLCRCP